MLTLEKYFMHKRVIRNPIHFFGPIKLSLGDAPEDIFKLGRVVINSLPERTFLKDYH